MSACCFFCIFAGFNFENMKRLSLALLYVLAAFMLDAQVVEKVYTIDNQNIILVSDGSLIELKDGIQSASVGQPSLPWQTVTLLLPQGTKAESMVVEMSDFQELEGRFDLCPYQPWRTYNDTEMATIIKDEGIYSSEDVYPVENQGVLTTQYVNGYSLAVSSFTPVKYVPAKGKVLIANKVDVKIYASPDEHYDSKMLSSRKQVVDKVKSLVHNPEMIDNYAIRDEKTLQGYELLVITPEQYVSNYNDYVQFYQYYDIRVNVVSLESICSSMQGVDNQEKMRNFIIGEYQNNDIMMVLLGGDVGLVPYRGFYCMAGSCVDENIPADLYFASLDGTWNDNGNELWGENGEDDLYPELGVARMPFNNAAELANMINKTIGYQQVPVRGEFQTVVLGGEVVNEDPYTTGGQFLDLLIGNRSDNGYTTNGFDENCDVLRFYDELNNWHSENFADAINNGCDWAFHAGPSDYDYLAGWNIEDITSSSFSGVNGVDHNYTFFYSHGNNSAGFDQESIMEKMLTIENFAVSVVGNSRYGWFRAGATEGAAIHLNREMINAFLEERIPYIGMAMSEARCKTAPWILVPGQDEDMALRWNFYDLTILGDVAVSPWFEEPYEAAVRFKPVMLPGETVNEVFVSHNGLPLENFRCSIYYNNVKLGEAVTDSTGNAVITLSEPIDFVGQASLCVTGMNSFPQVRIVDCIDNNTTYVKPYRLIANDEDGDGKIEPGENVSFDLVLKNWGMAAATNVHLTAQSCGSDYFYFTKNDDDVESIDALTVDTVFGAFGIVVSPDVPDGWQFGFNITSNDATGYWYNSFGFKASAPDVRLSSMSSEELEGNGNMVVEAGETGILTMNVVNAGSIVAENVVVNVVVDNELVTLENPMFEIPQIQEGEEIAVQTVFHIDENAVNGSVLSFDATVVCGKYQSQLNYKVAIGYIVDDFETGDFSKFDWGFAGSSEWTVTNADSYEGDFSARSGVITNNEVSSLIINIEVFEEGEMSFYYKTSTEKNVDYLEFCIHNEVRDCWSGNNDWQSMSYSLAPGCYQLEWRFRKTLGSQPGTGEVFIDYVTFPTRSLVMMNIEESNDNQCDIEIYPNPSDGVFAIRSSNSDNSVTVINSLGQVVYKKEKMQAEARVDLSGMKPGVYFLIINEKTKKIVIK